MNLEKFSEIISQSHRNGLVVLDYHGKLWGIVTVSDLEQAIENNLSLKKTLVGEIATQRDQLLVAFPDETMGDVLNRMSFRGVGRLPVVSRDDPSHLLGMIRRNDTIRAYNIALTKRAEIQHKTKRIQARNIDSVDFVELQLFDGDDAVGKSVIDLAKLMPEECVLVSLRRNGKVIIPHGTTKFQAGDHVTAFIESKGVELLYKCFRDGDISHPIED